VARIAGVDLPRNKRIEVALTYIYGIGRSTARKICAELGMDLDRKSDDLSEDEVQKIRGVIDSKYQVEGELRSANNMSIKRLVDLGCYRGLRHRRGLPVRGQRTSSNARTRKGPAVAIAGKKSIKSMKG